MVRRRTAGEKPSSYVVSGVWPNAVIDDPAARYAQEIARRLQAAMGARSLREVADLAGVTHPTVRSVLNGDHWPEVATLALLELRLGVRLWPD